LVATRNLAEPKPCEIVEKRSSIGDLQAGESFHEELVRFPSALFCSPLPVLHSCLFTQPRIVMWSTVRRGIAPAVSSSERLRPINPVPRHCTNGIVYPPQERAQRSLRAVTTLNGTQKSGGFVAPSSRKLFLIYWSKAMCTMARETSPIHHQGDKTDHVAIHKGGALKLSVGMPLKPTSSLWTQSRGSRSRPVGR
jgi:hypothetical protein